MSQPYPPPGPGFVPPGVRVPPPLPPRGPDGIAIAGFAVALVGALLSLVPIIGTFAWLLCPVGLGLSIAGLVRGVRRRTGRVLAALGMVLALVGLGICTLQAQTWLSAVPQAAPPPAWPPGALDRAAGPVTLEVAGADAYALVRYTTSNGAVTEVDTALPFHATVVAPPTGLVVLSATATPDEDQPAGPIYCTMTQAGHVLVSNGAEGRIVCSAQ